MTRDRPVPNTRFRYGLLAAVGAVVLLVVLLPASRAAVPDGLAPWLISLGSAGLSTGLLLLWSPGLLDTYPRARTLRIALYFAPPVLLYALAMDRWPDVLDSVPAGGLRIAAGCLPAVLVLWACWAFARYMRLLDELQQHVELVSVALATALTCSVAAAAGGLHLAGAVEVNGRTGLWVFPLLLMAYSLIRAALTRRYQ